MFGFEVATARTNERPEAAALVEVLKALRHHPAIAWAERDCERTAAHGGLNMETTVIAAGPLDIPVMPGEPENRYCSHCGHHGDDNDAATETACCLHCEQAQPYPCDDHCAHCGEDGAMGMACPECNGPYRLDDNYA